MSELQVTVSERGFPRIMLRPYPDDGVPAVLVAQSSMVGNYEDAFARPGSSYLWVGDAHHLDRGQVAALRDHLTAWLETGDLRGARPARGD